MTFNGTTDASRFNWDALNEHPVAISRQCHDNDLEEKIFWEWKPMLMTISMVFCVFHAPFSMLRFFYNYPRLCKIVFSSFYLRLVFFF